MVTSQVLDKGFVNLEDFMGGDLSVVNSAKVSFAKRSSEMGEAEGKLIRYLMRHRHGSPFEHSYFTFHVKAPLFVVREWQRHRIGSFNEMSGRYVKFEPEFYVPEKVRVPAETNKQGSVLPDDEWFAANRQIGWLGTDIAERWNPYMRELLREAYASSFARYNELIKTGVAKELARMVLPLSLYTEFYWTVNARSLMNFLSLRTGEDAQFEIREYAYTVETFFKDRMPVTHDAWINNNRLAP